MMLERVEDERRGDCGGVDGVVERIFPVVDLAVVFFLAAGIFSGFFLPLRELGTGIVSMATDVVERRVLVFSGLLARGASEVGLVLPMLDGVVLSIVARKERRM
jgi:hypothetical protein